MNHENSRFIELLDDKISPYQAKEFLKSLGIEEKDWGEILSKRNSHHALQGLISIAQGSEAEYWARATSRIRQKLS